MWCNRTEPRWLLSRLLENRNRSSTRKGIPGRGHIISKDQEVARGLLYTTLVVGLRLGPDLQIPVSSPPSAALWLPRELHFLIPLDWVWWGLPGTKLTL